MKPHLLLLNKFKLNLFVCIFKHISFIRLCMCALFFTSFSLSLSLWLSGSHALHVRLSIFFLFWWTFHFDFGWLLVLFFVFGVCLCVSCLRCVNLLQRNVDMHSVNNFIAVARSDLLPFDTHRGWHRCAQNTVALAACMYSRKQEISQISSPVQTCWEQLSFLRCIDIDIVGLNAFDLITIDVHFLGIFKIKRNNSSSSSGSSSGSNSRKYAERWCF